MSSPQASGRSQVPRRAGAASRGSDLLSLGSFVVLGLPDGMLGTAWPSMRLTFGAPVGDLGLILLIATAGSVLATAFVGPLITRLGVPAVLAASGSCAALGAAGFALAPGFWLVLSVAALWLRQRRRDGARAAPAEHPHAAEPEPAVHWSRRRYRLVVAVGMSVFFVYTGLEVSAGQWEASFCRGHLNLSATATGLATFGYWGALTAVRIALALPRRPVTPRTVVRWGSALSVIAAAVIWLQPGVAATVIGFAVLGAALAGVFPALVALTPVRVGPRQAHHVIAWQVGAATAGGAGISALTGLLIGATSLAILGPALTVLAVLVVAAELILTRLAPIHPNPPQPARDRGSPPVPPVPTCTGRR